MKGLAGSIALMTALSACNDGPPSETQLQRRINAAQAGVAEIQADRIRREAEHRASLLDATGQPDVQRRLVEAHIAAEPATRQAENVLAEGYRRQADEARTLLCQHYGIDCPSPTAHQKPAEPAPAR